MLSTALHTSTARPSRARRPLAVLAAAGLVLGATSCAASAAPADQGLTVVASTPVYASLVDHLLGDRGSVSSLIESAAQDPHSYEASARDKLRLSKADLVVLNGGGYDAFAEQVVDSLPERPAVIEAYEGEDHVHSHGEEEDAHEATSSAAPATSATVSATASASAVSSSEAHDEHDHAHEHEGHDHDHAHEATEASSSTQTHDEHSHDATQSASASTPAAEEHSHEHSTEGHDHGNEHVWYDLALMQEFVHRLGHELAELDPDGATDYEKRTVELEDRLGALAQRLEQLKPAAEGKGYLMTEPVAQSLVEDAGLSNRTPEGLAEAIEEGDDITPLALKRAKDELGSGRVAVLVYNSQTTDEQTKLIESSAKEANVPVLEVAESPAPGTDYLEWMGNTITNLEGILR